jgi:c-di-GMP-binding flagellar brake protein YcgR
MFQPLPNSESQKVIQTLLSGKVSIVGRTDNGILILAKSFKGQLTDFKQFDCEFKSNKELPASELVTFSFVSFGKKFLFKANCHVKTQNTIKIFPVTELFFLQRRNADRLIIPENYYAVFKMTHINGKPSKTFLKITNISIGGCGLLLRSEEPNINPSDVIKGAIHFSSRPPLDIEAQIRHKRIIEEGSLKLQQLGVLFLPADSVTISKKMKIIVMDIYRDLFSEQ